jgi:hypothetical protein
MSKDDFKPINNHFKDFRNSSKNSSDEEFSDEDLKFSSDEKESSGDERANFRPEAPLNIPRHVPKIIRRGVGTDNIERSI